MVFLAPEVAGAAEAAGEAEAGGGARAARGAGAAKRRPGRGTLAHQRAAIEHLKASRPAPEPEPEGQERTPAPPVTATAASEPAAGLGAMDPVHTGSGVVLGTLAWVLFMNYLRGGMPQVKRWGAAKFLNKVTPTGGTK